MQHGGAALVALVALVASMPLEVLLVVGAGGSSSSSSSSRRNLSLLSSGCIRREWISA